MQRKLAAIILVLILLTACSIRQTEPVLPRGQTLAQLHLAQNGAGEHLCAWIPYFTVTDLCQSGDEEICRAAVSDYLEKASTYGITDIFLHVCAFGESFYPSDYYPPVPEANGLDLMRIFSDICPRFGMALHAWINPLRLQTPDRLDHLTGDQRLAAWYRAPQTKAGNLSLWAGRYYLNPGQPAVRDFLAGVVRELVERYQPAGVHIDDYFYPTLDERFDAAIFQQSGAQSLHEWRVENISQTVQGMYRAAHETVDDTAFSISPQGKPEVNREELCADVLRWLREPGFCDVLMPQIYFGYRNELCPFTELLEQWRTFPRDSAVELIPGLAAYKAGQADLYAGDGQAEWQNDPSVLARETAQVLAAEEFSGAAFYHLDALLGLPKAEQSSLRETLRAFSADDAPTRTGT